MQIRLADLATRLERDLAPVYAVHGDEPLLALEAGDLIRSAARRHGFDDREVAVVDAHFDWPSLLASSLNLSLFGGRKLIDLRIPGGRPGTAGSGALQQLAADRGSDRVLLVTLPRLDRASQASAWFSALDQAGVSIACPPLTREELPRWIASRLARQQQRASADTLQFLADRTEGNLLAAHQEIVKLGLLLPAGPLDAEEVARAVGDVARFDLVDLSEAWLSGNAARVARILDRLEAEGEGPQLILWQLGEDLHALYSIGEAIAAGTPAGDAARAVRAWGRRQELLQRAARRLQPQAIAPLLTALAHLDALSKGIGRRSVPDLLTDVALSLAGRPAVRLPADVGS